MSYQNRPRLYAMAGLARSGKTTLVQKWLDYIIDFHVNIYNTTYIYWRSWTTKNGTERPRVVVRADDIRLALHGQRFCKLAEHYVHATKLLMVRTLLHSGHDVIVDGTHTTEGSIRELLEINPATIFYFVDTKPDVCIERAHATNQSDLEPVIERMSENLIRLNSKYSENGFWDDPTLLYYNIIEGLRS